MRGIRGRALIVAMAAATALTLGWRTHAEAQDASAGLAAWKRAACGDCHGWAAHGVKDDPESPDAPNLRRTTLDRDVIREVVQCGRPRTEMPFHDSRAYTDDRCYGLVFADLDRAPAKGATLSASRIDAVTEYLMTWIVGRDVDLEFCGFYFNDPNHTRCRRYQQN